MDPRWVHGLGGGSMDPGPHKQVLKQDILIPNQIKRTYKGLLLCAQVNPARLASL